MKSTTVRFADPVYRELEIASRLTGLPINSIVTVACMEWLRRNIEPDQRPLRAATMLGWRQQPMRRWQREMVDLVPRRLTWTEPLWPFTLAAGEALNRALEAAERGRRPWIGTGDLLQGLAEVPEGRAARALARLGIDAAGLAGVDGEEAAERSERLLPTRQVRQVLRHAQQEAEDDGAALMGTGHLLLGLLLAPDSRVAGALAAAGATEPAVREALQAVDPED